uniref:Uncharacterized protein n=1 Tax=Cacopsylla melanoneura TaxID=428564 RepID=A0A8D8SJC6_9HEMI
MRAADLDTFSMSFPSMISSSFCLELDTLTPGAIFTLRMYFSPKKLRISNRVLFSDVTQLMGKWAYTALILYRKPLVTPFNMLEMCEHTVLTAAISFLVPNHFSTFNTLLLTI